MSRIDLRRGINAISDVIINRPKPLRIFDQIYMKAADMLLQADHISRRMHNKKVVFIGDGDSIALCLVHLAKQGILEGCMPKQVVVLDFDERIINSVQRFAEHNELADIVSAELYNVADKLPQKFWQSFDCFYTNPPFGFHNDGKSVEVWSVPHFLDSQLCSDRWVAAGCWV